MRQALREAAKGRGLTSPNPAVGAVLVHRGEIVARGHHRKAGEPHAEIECLSAFGREVPSSAILYVTLEPCSTAGRTPPCTDALVRAGVKKIVTGTADPNPRHSGQGIQQLRTAGVEVRVGVLEKECAELNEVFNKWIRTKIPFVIAKCGMSLDGRLTRPPAEGQWITSSIAREHANRFRAQVDAIVIGAETLRADDPRLTVRGVRPARQPWRIILTRSGKLPKSARIFNDRYAKRTLVLRDEPLVNVLKDLGQRDITSVLIEGGGNVLGQALDARLIDRARVYLGPILTGGPVVAFAAAGARSTQEGMRLREVQYERIGDNIFLTGLATSPEVSPE